MRQRGIEKDEMRENVSMFCVKPEATSKLLAYKEQLAKQKKEDYLSLSLPCTVWC